VKSIKVHSAEHDATKEQKYFKSKYSRVVRNIHKALWQNSGRVAVSVKFSHGMQGVFDMKVAKRNKTAILKCYKRERCRGLSNRIARCSERNGNYKRRFLRITSRSLNKLQIASTISRIWRRFSKDYATLDGRFAAILFCGPVISFVVERRDVVVFYPWELRASPPHFKLTRRLNPN